MTVFERDRKAYQNLNHFEKEKLKTEWEDWESKFPLCNEVFFGKEEGKLERILVITNATIK